MFQYELSSDIKPQDHLEGEKNPRKLMGSFSGLRDKKTES